LALVLMIFVVALAGALLIATRMVARR
jgi:hypothetical protein